MEELGIENERTLSAKGDLEMLPNIYATGDLAGPSQFMVRAIKQGLRLNKILGTIHA